MRRRSASMNDRRWEMSTALWPRIPLESLIQTVAVTEYLNFRHAAYVLGLSQSSISARVKVLDEDLGILLVRHSDIRSLWLIVNRWEAASC